MVDDASVSDYYPPVVGCGLVTPSLIVSIVITPANSSGFALCSEEQRRTQQEDVSVRDGFSFSVQQDLVLLTAIAKKLKKLSILMSAIVFFHLTSHRSNAGLIVCYVYSTLVHLKVKTYFLKRKCHKAAKMSKIL